MQYYHPTRGLRPCRELPSWRSPWHLKSIKKGVQKRIVQKVPLWAPCWRLWRPKRSIVANLAPKTPPKWSPKRTQSDTKREPAQKHEKLSFCCYLLHLSHVDCLPKGSFFDDFWEFFRSFFRGIKKTPKNRDKRSRLETLAPK